MPAVVIDLDNLDWDMVNGLINAAAVEGGEWAGAPRLCDIPLVLEPRYPYQDLQGQTCEIYGDIDPKQDHPEPETADPDSALGLALGVAEALLEIRTINSWWCERWMARVDLVEFWDFVQARWRRRACWSQDQGWPLRWRALLQSFSPAGVLDPEAELAAQARLRELISPRQWRFYVLTNAFLEHSPRSNITYVFRKGAPTLAMGSHPDGTGKLLTALCLHPIGYYDGTHMGCLVASDDLISHLLLMRGDEHKFWGKAQHHAPHLVSARI